MISLTKQLQPIDNATLSDKVYNILKDRIILRELAPGEKLDIHALAKVLGISRTPIKEAFNRLSHEGFVTIYPHRGTFVKSAMSPKEIEEVFGARLMIELWGIDAAFKDPGSLNLERMTEAFRQCDHLFSSKITLDYMDYSTFFSADHEFHSAIVDAAKNSHIRRMYEVLAVHIRILRTYWGQPRDEALRSHEQHNQLLQAFRIGDPEVRVKLTLHMERSKNYALSLAARIAANYDHKAAKTDPVNVAPPKTL